MIENWRMHFFPSVEYEQRYKIKVKGEERDISSLVQKIGNNCGKPSQLDDEDYNWTLYVYKVEPGVKEKITNILNDLKESAAEAPAEEIRPEEKIPLVKEKPSEGTGIEVKPEVIEDNPESFDSTQDKLRRRASPEPVEGKEGFGAAGEAEPEKKEEGAFGTAAAEEKPAEAGKEGFGAAGEAEPEKKEEGAFGTAAAEEKPAEAGKEGFGAVGEAEPEKKEEGAFGTAAAEEKPGEAEPGAGETSPEPVEGKKEEEKVPVSTREEKETGLISSYTFENFVVGASNRFANAAAQAVAKNPGQVYNPLFLYGGVGLGKTHLMHAIGHYIRKNNPEKKMFYVTTEKFISEVIEAISNGTIQELRDKYRELDLLMIDDIQFLVEAESTQEDFFHTFNVLHNNHKQIVITCDKPPKQLTTLEDRLKSRFEWGLIADIKSPDIEMRTAILKNKEEYKELKLSDNILLYIAGRLKSNIRELEGFLKRIYAYAHMTKQKVDMEIIKELMNDLLPEEEKEEVKEETVSTEAGGKEVEKPKKKIDKAAAIEKLKELSRPTARPEKKGEPKPAPTAKPGVPEGEKEEEKDKSARPVEVAYFYPRTHDEECRVMKEYFDTTSKKHKLKFNLVGVFDREYEVEEKINYAMFAELCKTNNVKSAIVLGPPQDGALSHDVFSEEITKALETKAIAVQIVSFDDLRKEYKYLNLLLDMVLIGHKNIFLK